MLLLSAPVMSEVIRIDHVLSWKDVTQLAPYGPPPKEQPAELRTTRIRFRISDERIAAPVMVYTQPGNSRPNDPLYPFQSSPEGVEDISYYIEGNAIVLIYQGKQVGSLGSLRIPLGDRIVIFVYR